MCYQVTLGAHLHAGYMHMIYFESIRKNCLLNTLQCILPNVLSGFKRTYFEEFLSPSTNTIQFEEALNAIRFLYWHIAFWTCRLTRHKMPQKFLFKASAFLPYGPSLYYLRTRTLQGWVGGPENGNFLLLYVVKMFLRRWVGGSKKAQKTLT